MTRALSWSASFLVVLCASRAVLAEAGSASRATMVSRVDEPWATGGDASPAFAPDGRTVYFTHGDGAQRRIMVSALRGRSWTTPATAPFSGVWMDIEPAMAPDGSYLVFISNRPHTHGGAPLDGTFGGKLHPGRGGNLWRVNLQGPHREPTRLPDFINRDTSIYSPAVAPDGSIYFMAHDPTTGRFRIYRAPCRAGQLQPPEPLPFSDGTTADSDPAIAPDGSFLVFSSGRPPTPAKQSDLFLVRAERGEWGQPVPLGITGYEARFGPAAATLYFSSEEPPAPGAAANATGEADRIHQVSMTALLRPVPSVAPPSAQPATERAAAISLAAEPRLVGPGTISTAAEEFKATVAPDGATMVFVVTDHQFRHMTLVESRRSHGSWSTPVVASFSGIWRDGDPSFAPDGQTLVFISNRPLPDDRPGTVRRDFNLWRVPRRPAGTWGEPTALSRIINSDASEFAPSLTRSGVLYFSRGEQVFRATPSGDDFAAPELLPFAGADPAVAPDDSYLVIDGDSPTTGDADLFVSCRTATGWAPPRQLRGPVSSPFREGDPSVSSDGRTLYFFSERFAPAPDRVPRVRAATYGEIAREALDTPYNGSRNIYEVDVSSLHCPASLP